MAMDEKVHGYAAANAASTASDVTIENMKSHVEKLRQAFVIDQHMFRAMADPVIVIPPELERDLRQAVQRRVLPMCDYNVSLLSPIRHTVLSMPFDWQDPAPVKHPERPKPFVSTPWRAHEVLTLLVFGITILILLSKAIQ